MVQLTASSIDQGWAWLVMLGCFINILTTMTFIRSTSIFFLVFLEKFQESATMTTLSFSLNTIFFSIGSIIVSVFLLPHFSVRRITLIGATLVSASIIGMAFATSINYIHVAFCVLGLSHPLLFIAQTTLMGVYFKKRLSFALAFANLGLSIATMAGPAFTQLLLEKYGLHGAILIHGGVNLQTIVACMLFWPAPVDTSSTMAGKEEVSKLVEEKGGSELVESKDLNDEFMISLSQSNLDVRSNHSAKTEEGNRKGLLMTLKSRNFKPLHGSLSRITQEKQNTRLRSHDELSYHASQPITHLDSSVHSLNKINSNRLKGFTKASILATDLFNTLSVSNTSIQQLDYIPSNGNCEEINGSNVENALQTKPTFLTNDSDPENQVNDRKFAHIENTDSNYSDKSFAKRRKVFSKWFRSVSESPLSHPIVWLLIFAAGFGVNTQCGASYVPSLGKEQGVTEHHLPYLMTAIGASDLLKLLVGYIADKNLIKRIHITCLCQLVVGSLFQLAGLCQGFVAMMAFSLVFGAATGSFHVLLPGITVDLLGPHYIGPVMSGYFLVNGAVMSTSHVVVGLLKDNTGSFVGSYHFIGAMMLLGMIILLLEPCVRKVHLSKQRPTSGSGAKCRDDVSSGEQGS